jgi:tetratricopeptide (TPR) repeat protein
MVETTGALGEADIGISISGSQNSGTLYAVATKRRGRDKWTFTLLEVLVDGQGEPIDLLEGGPILDENQQAADIHYERGYNYSNSGHYEQAMAEYTKATELDPEFAAAYNSLCWTGSLFGQATEVKEACERGVELDPDNGAYRDSRGLARALTGDYAGAIEDFRFFVTWSKSAGYETMASKREAWIAELEAQRNPFDEATLEELQNE